MEIGILPEYECAIGQLQLDGRLPVDAESRLISALLARAPLVNNTEEVIQAAQDSSEEYSRV